MGPCWTARAFPQPSRQADERSGPAALTARFRGGRAKIGALHPMRRTRPNTVEAPAGNGERNKGAWWMAPRAASISLSLSCPLCRQQSEALRLTWRLVRHGRQNAAEAQYR
jgi:hypothetical protein